MSYISNFFSKINLIFTVISLAVLFAFFFTSVNCKCTMLNICGEKNKHDQNCLNDPPEEPIKASSLSKDSQANLRKYCPFFYDDQEDPDVCCNDQQLANTVQGFTLTAPFERCPTCVKNIFTVYCYFSCSGNQSLFTTQLLNETNESTGEGKRF